jgi:hypothetical protein
VERNFEGFCLFFGEIKGGTWYHVKIHLEWRTIPNRASGLVTKSLRLAGIDGHNSEGYCWGHIG